MSNGAGFLISGDDMTVKILTWDWKEYPDWEEIAAAANEVSAGGVGMALADTHSDMFALVIADHPITENEATAIWEECADDD